MRNPAPAAYLRCGLLAALLLFTWHIRASQMPHPIDDAHITYRHVLNFCRGNGWVFNAGDGFLSSSTPLYMALLTALQLALGIDSLPDLSVFLNRLFDCGILAYAYLGLLDSRRSPVRAFFLAFPLALYPRLLDYSGCGMESSLFTLLILLAGRAWSLDRWKTAGALFGLVILTRLDGLIPAAACLGLSYRQPKQALAALGMAALVAAPWFLYSHLEYGAFLPVTVGNKLNPGGAANLPTLLVVFAEVSPAAMALPASMALRGSAWAIGFGLLWASGWLLAQRRHAPREDRRRALALFHSASALLFMAAYTIGSPPLYGWYQVPIGVSLLAVAMLGQEAWIGSAGAWFPEGRKRAWVPILIAAALCGLTLWGWENRINYFPGSQARFSLVFDWSPLREQAYRKLARDLEGLTRPEDQVFLEEVGTFGYYSDLKTLDGTGLTSPEFGKPMRNKAVEWSRIISERKPRWLLMRDSDFGVLRIRDGYRPLAPDSDPAEDYGLRLFRRRDGAPSG